MANDALSLTWTTRYVHRFFYGWQSGGTDKAEIPAQLQHTLLLSYVLRLAAELIWSAELQNLGNAKIYDYLGIPKPGRAFFSKVAVVY